MFCVDDDAFLTNGNNELNDVHLFLFLCCFFCLFKVGHKKRMARDKRYKRREKEERELANNRNGRICDPFSFIVKKNIKETKKSCDKC